MSCQVLVVMLAMAQGNGTDPGSGPLSPKQKRDLQTACVAFEQGAPLHVVRHLGPLVSKAELLPAVEATLKRRDLPSLGEVLALARLEVARQGATGKVPRAQRSELLLLLPAVKKYLHDKLDHVAGRPVMRDVMPLPESLKDFQETFWELDVVTGQLADIELAATYLRTLARRVPRADMAKLDGEVRQMIENDDVAALLESMDLMRRGIQERRVELALARLKVAIRTLSQQPITPRHLIAAAVWQRDHELASTYLKNLRGKPARRAALREEGLRKKLTADGELARKLAGTLTVKAQLLHEGLEWWMRGRYGMGPEVMGLVKSQQAMRSPAGRYHVFLPNETPKPIDPFENEPAKYRHPTYQRRHLVTWAWNNRYVTGADQQQWQTSISDLVTRTEKRTSRCNTTHTYTVEVPVSYTKTTEWSASSYRDIVERDNENLMRLVGFLEYARALAHFDQLLKTATSSELAAMDEMVKSHDQYTIFVNLSRKLPQMATTRFPEVPRDAEDKFERRGLAWVIALARLEVGAMLAAYSRKTDTFERARPSKYESPAYEELLVDAMRMHLWTLQADPLSNERNLRQAALRNQQIALLYERRVRLALKLVDAVHKWSGQRATQAQLAELKQYNDKYQELLVVIQRKILRLGEDSASGTNVKKVKSK